MDYVFTGLVCLAIGLAGGWFACKKYGVKAAGVVTAIDSALGKK